MTTMARPRLGLSDAKINDICVNLNNNPSMTMLGDHELEAVNGGFALWLALAVVVVLLVVVGPEVPAY